MKKICRFIAFFSALILLLSFPCSAAPVLTISAPVDFNQQVQNGNFEYVPQNNSYSTVSVENNICSFTLNTSSGGNFQNHMISLNCRSISEHKYFVSFESKTEFVGSLFFIFANNTQPRLQFSTESDWHRYTGFLTAVGDNSTIRLCVSSSALNIPVFYRNVMVFDLTQMYGAGNEPTDANVVINRFPDAYYPYTASEVIDDFSTESKLLIIIIVLVMGLLFYKLLYRGWHA